MGKNSKNPGKRSAKKSGTAVTSRTKKASKAPSTVKPAKTVRELHDQIDRKFGPVDDNRSKRYPNGRTIKTRDKYLPTTKSSIEEKDRRWGVILDSNANDELAIVRLSSQNQPNTSPLPSYKRGNGKSTYFRHFAEIKDRDGNPIKIDEDHFRENLACYDLTPKELQIINEKLRYHTKQSQTNRENLAELKKRGKDKKK